MLLLPLLLCSILSAVVVCHLILGQRRSQHKLPPGPKPWPLVGNFPHMGPAPHRSLAELARVYGPLMHLRLGSVDIVVAASAAVAEQFLKTHDANFSSRPPNAGAKYVAYNYKDMVFGPYGPRWRLMRKISAVHLFSAKALDDYRHVRQEEVAVLVKALSSAGTLPVKLGQLVNECTANSLGRVMLGRRVFSDGSSDLRSHEFKSMVVETMVLSGMLNLGDFFPALQWLDLQRIQSKMKKIHRRFDTFLSVILENHKAPQGRQGGDGDNKVTDMLSTLLFSAGDGDKLTDIEIKALLLNMFIGGTDTSSSTVEWAIAELIKHPATMAQVQQELDSVVGKDRLVTETDLPRLTFFQAVIKEVFRLHPSTPLSLPRIASEACEVNGYYIPKGATLLVDIWAIGRDPNEWVKPLEFCPERFSPGAQKAGVDVKGNDFEIIPFGAGRRICAGLSLGVRMVQFLTATLAHAFEWQLPEGLSPNELNMEEAYGLTLQRAQPLVVKPKPRLPRHVYGSFQ